MKHFATYIWFNGEPKRVEFTQYKSKQMFISNMFEYNKHKIKLVKSYNTYIGFIVDNRAFITWGYSEYSSTTSKQITQLCNDYDLFMHRVKKFSYYDLEMLTVYLKEVA